MLDSKRIERLGIKPGECYMAAVKVAEELHGGVKGIRIVHGEPIGTGGEAEGLRYGHAWVEVRDMVYDASNPRLGLVVVPVSVYYALGSIEDDVCHKYSLEAARKLMVEHGHYGPWHEPPLTKHVSSGRL